MHLANLSSIQNALSGHPDTLFVITIKDDQVVLKNAGSTTKKSVQALGAEFFENLERVLGDPELSRELTKEDVALLLTLCENNLTVISNSNVRTDMDAASLAKINQAYIHVQHQLRAIETGGFDRTPTVTTDNQLLQRMWAAVVKNKRPLTLDDTIALLSEQKGPAHHEFSPSDLRLLEALGQGASSAQETVPHEALKAMGLPGAYHMVLINMLYQAGQCSEWDDDQWADSSWSDLVSTKQLETLKKRAFAKTYDDRALRGKRLKEVKQERIAANPEVKVLKEKIAEKKELLQKIPKEGRKEKLEELSPKFENTSAVAADDREEYELYQNLSRFFELEAEQSEYQLKMIVVEAEEFATQTVYQEMLPDRVAQGYYDPDFIHFDMNALLGVDDQIPPDIDSHSRVKELIAEDIDNYSIALSASQREHIKEEISYIIDNYQSLYRYKTPEQCYLLARSLARVIAYQEYYDKSTFTGSDHGSKHVAHNIDMADGLTQEIPKAAFNDKDKFVAHLIHMVHDIGYTVGLSEYSFPAMSDHPLIGAAWLEANRDMWVELLDEGTFDVMHDTVMKHAIARPDFTVCDADEYGLHPDMISSVVRCSDACATTYDRKTQEFWEQPEAVLLLARLKLFETTFPQYQSIFMKHADRLKKGDYEGILDPDNELDMMAFLAFKTTYLGLRALADGYVADKGKQDAFLNAIEYQFNGFTASVTLGQYGGVIESVSCEENPHGKAKSGSGSDYKPVITIAPSLIYGVLQDLFGEKQAAKAFSKLVEEFDGEPMRIQQMLNTQSEKLLEGDRPAPVREELGTGIFEVAGHFDVESATHTKQTPKLQESVVKVHSTLKNVGKSQIVFAERKKIVTRAVKKVADSKESPKELQVEIQNSLAPFLQDEKVVALMQEKGDEKIIALIKQYQACDKGDTKTKEALLGELEKMLTVLISNDEEWGFMFGEGSSRMEVLQRIIT